MLQALDTFPPLLLLVGACAFVVPALILRSRMRPWKVWTRGLGWICTSHFVVSFLVLMTVPPDLLGTMGYCHPIFLGPFLIVSLPCIAFLPPTIFRSLNPLVVLLLVLGNSVLWSLPVAGLCFLRRRKQEREERERKRTVEAAIEKITEDGVVEGPRSPYVPHKKWRKRNTPGNGYYGSG